MRSYPNSLVEKNVGSEPDCLAIVAASSRADLLNKVYPHNKGRSVDLGFNENTNVAYVIGPVEAVSEILKEVKGKLSAEPKERVLEGMRWIIYRTQ